VELMNADDADVRGNAAGALGAVGGPEDLAHLRNALKDIDGRVQVQAAKSIIQIRRNIKEQ